MKSALFIAAVAAAATAPAPGAPGSSDAPTGQYENATYGYGVLLPEPYRYSEILSRDMPNGQPVAQQVFTARTLPGEGAVKDQRCETFADLAVDGRPSVRVTSGARFPVALIVKDGDRRYEIGWEIYPPYTADFQAPPGATREKLGAILASVHFR